MLKTDGHPLVENVRMAQKNVEKTRIAVPPSTYEKDHTRDFFILAIFEHP